MTEQEQCYAGRIRSQLYPVIDVPKERLAELRFVQSPEHDQMLERIVDMLWGRLLELRPASAYHGVRVAALMDRFVRILAAEGIMTTAIERWAVPTALIHDAGKVTDQYFLKFPSGQCTNHRREDPDKLHTVLAADFLAELGFPPIMVEAVRTHHRNVDGTGRPELLQVALTFLGGLLRICDHLDVFVLSPIQLLDYPDVSKCVHNTLTHRITELKRRVSGGDKVNIAEFVRLHNTNQTIVQHLDSLDHKMIPFFGSRYIPELLPYFDKLRYSIRAELT